MPIPADRVKTSPATHGDGTGSVRVVHSRDEARLVGPGKAQARHRDLAFLAGDRLRAFEDETCGMFDADGLRLASHRILDGLQCQLERAADADGTVAAIEVKLDRRVDRIEHLGKSGGEDFKGKSAGLSGADGEQSLALPRVCALVDEKSERSIAKLNRFRPMRCEADSDAIERDIAETAFRNSPGPGAVTKAARRWCGELAGATVVAIARLEEISLERPFSLWRSHTPSVRRSVCED